MEEVRAFVAWYARAKNVDMKSGLLINISNCHSGRLRFQFLHLPKSLHLLYGGLQLLNIWVAEVLNSIKNVVFMLLSSGKNP
jgi:hypothetical protein